MNKWCAKWPVVAVFSTLLFITVSVAASSALTQLNDTRLHKMADIFDAAITQGDIRQLPDILADGSKVTVHAKHRGEHKTSMEFSKEDLISNIQTQLQMLNQLYLKNGERQETKINYLNENTQALMVYTLVFPNYPIQFENQLLFDLVEGKAVISKAIFEVETDMIPKP